MTGAVPILRRADSYRFGDGYDFISTLHAVGWRAIPAWGRDGWDLGDWPLVIFAEHVTQSGLHEVCEYVEGDLEITRWANRGLADSHLNLRAAWWWQQTGRGPDDPADGIGHYVPPEMPPRRGQGGFTLIELLVVIAILAVLGASVIIGIGALRGNAEEQVCSTDRETIETAAEAARIASGAAYLSIPQLIAGGYLKDRNDPATNFTINTTTGVVTPSATGKYAGVTC